MNMGASARQHTVPQQMIRRFASERGELFALRKSNLSMVPRPVRPGSILFRRNYYKDSAGDLDSEWLKPIEQRFAGFYPMFVDREWGNDNLSTQEKEALADWATSQLCRTGLLHAVLDALVDDEKVRPLLKRSPKTFGNLERQIIFASRRRRYLMPDWEWRCLVHRDEHNLVVTDHPVCTQTSSGTKGEILFVPLSRERVVVGGGSAALHSLRGVTVARINWFLAGWAEEWIYAADVSTLQCVSRWLVGEEGSNERGRVEAARQPFFGSAARLDGAANQIRKEMRDRLSTVRPDAM